MNPSKELVNKQQVMVNELQRRVDGAEGVG